MSIVIDFETYSPEDLAKVSSYKYMRHPSADIVCLAYKINERETRLWSPGMPAPGELFNAVESFERVYGHNILFDYLAWNILGNQYEFPELRLEQCIDTQAMCNRYTLPGALAKAGDVLGLEVQKQTKGSALMKLISFPLPEGSRPVLGVNYSQQDLLDYGSYCKDDVNSTYELIQTLPASSLSAEEQYYWELTQRMNMNGLPVDLEAAERILAYVSTYAEEMTLRVPVLTGGVVQKVTQVKKVRDWMKSKGVDVPNLTANTVEKLLTKKDLNPDVKEMLDLRQAIGRSSTAKFQKIVDMELDDRVYNNLHYYGAGTGRWAGRGFQMHNLPRATVPNPEELIDDFINFRPIKDPVNVAKALIRGMICAPDGRLLLVSDYSSIENRLLAFVAGDQEALELFRQNGDQYVEMAAYMYGVNESDVTKAQRQVGKVVILGCGFQMGGRRFRDTAAGWGIELEIHEAFAAVDAYRSKYYMTKKLWKELSNACINAIKHPGQVFEYNQCSFRVVLDRSKNRWLRLMLPSGRALYYKDPYLDQGAYGLEPGHYGINPYTKKWSRRKLIPGRITENIVQALARDIMGNGLRSIEQNMPEVMLLGQVHDEAIGEIDEQHGSDILAQFNESLCSLPEWAEGLPLAAEGYIAKRYKKG